MITLSNRSKVIIEDLGFSTAGVLLSAYALKGFLVPNLFLGGGITGISILLNQFFHFNFSIILILANLPLIFLGGYLVNKRFAYKTLACIIGLALCMEFINFPKATSDPSLISAFGGVFLGLGIGMAMKGGCALDGIEIIALYTIRKSGFTISEIIFAINVVIFLVAALNFGMDIALNSILTYYTASQAINFVVEGMEEYTGVTIISGQSDAIKRTLVMDLGRGITVYKGERGFMKESFETSQECDIVFTVITRLEVRRLKNLVYRIDPKAFVFTNSIKEAAGGILKRSRNSREE
ncbi:MAG TPA: YitT family protein [Catalimonadaceae bacterium]|nr:YitT family protein [Catalimonadaceae bacterium]